ncbi:MULTISPECIES: GntR family transcriptional regulator [unclassified Enterococcus]|jgi:GntR family transcriptional regulator|uniref:GntR family transcriptional regulator n=1 Tax=unclassified Enterococcus TaxID=2608891 RepID=UPI0006BA0545|nr:MULTISPECIES: GntR family transcriptional regulator [unclassified Enterococcus]KPG68503.1 transcriptional regulator [Enterococcus sp. RIT-PI-f]
MTKYKKITEDLRHKIYNGTYSTMEKLPEQNELSKKYATSRMTIQRALNLLKEEGLITTKRGQGTFVNSSSYQGKISEYIGLVNKFGGRHQVTSQIISFSARFPEANEMDCLLLKENDVVYDIVRLRYVDQEPFELEYTIMPIKTIPDITLNILEKSIYQYITDTLHLKIGTAIRKIRADRADTYDINYLQVDPADPILELEQVARLSDGRPFEFSQTRYPFQNREIYYISEP